MAMSLPWRSVAVKLPASELRTRESLSRDEHLTVSRMRVMLWTFFFFKMATIAAVFWAAGGTAEASILISSTTWPWLIIPCIVLSGTVAYQIRLRRVRARREALQRAEWMLDQRETMGEIVRPKDLDV